MNMTSLCGNPLLKRPALVESSDLNEERVGRMPADVRTIYTATNTVTEASQASNG